jgi:hypothetical protein
MNSVKYVGLDVHQATISVAVLSSQGRLLMTSVIATQATAILDFVQGVRGTLHVACEEGTHSGGWPKHRASTRVAHPLGDHDSPNQR